MTLPNLPGLLVPHELSDEAAAHVSELLNDLVFAFDAQYFRPDPPLLRRASRHRTRLP